MKILRNIQLILILVALLFLHSCKQETNNFIVTNNITINNNYQTINWEIKSPDIKSFRIQISKNKEFSDVVIDEKTLSTNEYKIPKGKLINGKYYYRVCDAKETINDNLKYNELIVNIPEPDEKKNNISVTEFTDNFDDGNFTNNPTWILSPGGKGCWEPGIREVVNGEFHVKDMDSPGCGHSTLIEYNLNFQVTEQTRVKFDVKPVFSDVRNGAGDTHEEYPGMVMLDLNDRDNNLLRLWFCYNYRGCSSKTSNNFIKVAFPNVPQNVWQRNQSFTIKDYFPNAVRIVKIYVGANGWDYESYFDNINISNQ